MIAERLFGPPEELLLEPFDPLSLTVVLGALFPCFDVTYLPFFAERYFPPPEDFPREPLDLLAKLSHLLSDLACTLGHRNMAYFIFNPLFSFHLIVDALLTL